MTAEKKSPPAGTGGRIEKRLARPLKGASNMSKQTRKSKPMSWFKCWFHEWDAVEALALDLETTGFLHLLKLRMAERRSPLPEQFLPHVARGKRLNRRSIDRMLKTLIGYGLIVRENGLIWNKDIAEDIDGFFDVSQKFDQSFAKVSPEQKQKTQRNQGNASTEVEGDKEGDREAPQGASQYQGEDNVSNSGEPVSASADRSPTGDRDQDYTCEDLQEIERRNAAFATGPLPKFDGEEAPPPTSMEEAEHQSFADEDQNVADDDVGVVIPYDNPSSDEGGSDFNDASSDNQAEPIAAVAEDRATFVTQMPHRWPEEYDPDAEYDEAGEPIRNEGHYDFENDADEEFYDGARQ